MPYNLFKEVKVKCGYCQNIIVSVSDNQWVECPCGKTKVMGKSFKRIAGDNYVDLTLLDFTDVPEHRGWDDKKEDYYKQEGNP